MAKESFWFKHDYNARSDRRMMSLLMKSGVQGIGIYWCVVEMLYEEGGYLMRSDCSRIAFELRTDCENVTAVIESDLFLRDEEKFWSESVLRRLNKRHETSAKNSKSAKDRWEKERLKKEEEEERQRQEMSQNDANAYRTQCERIPNAMQPQCAPDATDMLIRGEEKRIDSLYLSSISNEVSIKREELEVKIEVIDVPQKKEEKASLKIPFSDEAFLNQWREWKDFKAKEHKFHYKTPQSEQAALNELEKLAGGVQSTAIEIIHKSIANGWKGFFELKNNNQNGKGQYSNNSNRTTVNFSTGTRKPL